MKLPTLCTTAIIGIAIATSAAAQQKTIGFAAPNLAASFWISGSYGIDDEAKKLGVAVVKVNAGGDGNVSQQISQIQDLIQRKVDAIIVGATNGEAVKAVVEQAIARGIPVVGLSSPPATPQLASIVSADHYDMGKLQAQCLARSLNGAGNVAMVAGPAGQVWADRRAAGFKETLAKEFPNVKIIAESRTGDNRNQALTTAEDWIQRFPEMNGVYAATDDMAAGVVSALKSAKRLERVRVSASNLSPTAQQLLKDGEIVCTSIQQVVTQGRNALRQAVAAANKAGNEARVVLPAVLVTTQNLNTVDLSGVVAPTTYRP
jgi:TMAO reductase system protein TorT